MKTPLWWRRLKSIILPARRLLIIDGDSLPKHIPYRNIILARDENEDWCIGMRCPCGCGRTIELLLIPDVTPNWKLTIDPKNLPSLSPSVWLKTGCHSHFWLIHGRIHWHM